MTRGRRRKRLPKPSPPVYVSLAEVKAQGRQVQFDRLIPTDRQRVSAAAMDGFDRLPRPVRDRLNEVTDYDSIKLRVRVAETGETRIIVTSLLQLCVNLVDSGKDTAHILGVIDNIDAGIREAQRSQLLLRQSNSGA